MIFLKSIHIESFKGLENLTCTFDDLTVLSGLNNSGKTSVLQAIHILVNSVQAIARRESPFHPQALYRVIDLKPCFSALGIPSADWLMPFNDWSGDFKVRGDFYNDVRITIEKVSVNKFQFDVVCPPESPEERTELLDKLTLTSEFVLPPGIVASHENMVSGPRFRESIATGKGAQLWRNKIYWDVQKDGIEGFESVKSLVKQYFPDIEINVPVLDPNSNIPTILIKFSASEKGALDISQSGSGLRTFLTLARMLEQSPAEIILLDEPDAHLHSSQQAIVLELLLNAATALNRQVVVATHSPEILARAPVECVRWVTRENPTNLNLKDSEDLTVLLDRLGATRDVYLSPDNFPDRIIYVEGKTDKPVIESLVRWCRNTSKQKLASTLVITHRDGKFDAVAVQAILRIASSFNRDVHVIGIRDLDWDYCELPDSKPTIRDGDRWKLIDLPCKELENLLCDPKILHANLEGKLTIEKLQRIVDAESNAPELIDRWRNNILPKIREGLGNKLADPTREQKANQIFDDWKTQPTVRRRLVAGKDLLSRIRKQLRNEHKVVSYLNRVIEEMECLTDELSEIAKAIFPELEFATNADKPT